MFSTKKNEAIPCTVDDLEPLPSLHFTFIILYQGHYVEPNTFCHYNLFRSTESSLLRSPAEQRFCTTECVILPYVPKFHDPAWPRGAPSNFLLGLISHTGTLVYSYLLCFGRFQPRATYPKRITGPQKWTRRDEADGVVEFRNFASAL